MRNIKSVKIKENQANPVFTKVAAFAITWGIIIPLIAAGVIATWNLLLGLLGII
jgi:hypothetical protein